jgi:hypothetical protein
MTACSNRSDIAAIDYNRPDITPAEAVAIAPISAEAVTPDIAPAEAVALAEAVS